MAGYVARFLAVLRDHPYLVHRCPGLAPHVLSAQLGGMSEGTARGLFYVLPDLIERLEDYPCYLHRPPRRWQIEPGGPADIEFLTLVEGEEELRCGIRLLDRPRHMLCAGATGSGKTTALRNAIVKVHELGQQDPEKAISTLVFQLKAGDFGDLRQMLGDVWLQLGVHDGVRLGLNGPEDMPPPLWTQILATIFSARAGLIYARVPLAWTIRWLLPLLNGEQTGPVHYPDWQSVLSALGTMPRGIAGFKTDYLQSLGTKVCDVVQSTGELFRAWRGLDIEADIVARKRSAVLDISTLYPPWVRLYVVDYLLAQLLFGRMHRRHRVDRTEVLVVIDEADALASRETEACFPDGLSPLALLLKQGREFGIAVCVGLSVMGSASRQILSNVQYHLCLNLSDEESVHEARRTLMLPPGAERQFPALQPGEGIFREAQGAWPHPMWVKVDYVPPCRQERREPNDCLPFVPAKSLEEIPRFGEAVRELWAEHDAGEMRRGRRRKAKSSKALSKNAHRLLHAWALHPYTPVARLWDGLKKPSAAVQKAVREELVKELAEFQEVRIGKRNMLFMRPTDAGWGYVKTDPPRRRGRGGVAHTHFCEFICCVGRKRGYKAMSEWLVPGTSHPMDAVWLIDGKAHGFEVIVESRDNLVSHLEACFLRSDKVATVRVVATQKRIVRQLEELLDREIQLMAYRPRIRFEEVHTFIQELWP